VNNAVCSNKVDETYEKKMMKSEETNLLGVNSAYLTSESLNLIVTRSCPSILYYGLGLMQTRHGRQTCHAFQRAKARSHTQRPVCRRGWHYQAKVQWTNALCGPRGDSTRSNNKHRSRSTGAMCVETGTLRLLRNLYCPWN